MERVKPGHILIINSGTPFVFGTMLENIKKESKAEKQQKIVV